MLLNFLAVVLGCIILSSKIHSAKGSNATSTLSSTAQLTASTTKVVQSSPMSSMIYPTTTTTVSQATVTPPRPPPSTRPPQSTRPPRPTQAPVKRSYGFTVTLENLPYPPEDQTKKYYDFLEEMKVLFQNGSFPEYKDLVFAFVLPKQLFINDSGKTRTKFIAKFDAVPVQGSTEPEMYFRLKNFEKGSKYNYYVVPSSINVEEKVKGGVILGNWTSEGDIPEFCCGEGVYQTRNCSEPSSGTCDGLHLQRTIPCHLIYPIKCGQVRKFTFNMTLANAWKDGYKDSSSSEYKEFVAKLTTGDESLLEEVKQIFKTSRTGYKAVNYTSMKMSQDKGQVQISFTVLFNEPPSNPEDPEALFRFKTDNGKLGHFQINTKSIRIVESVHGYTFTPWTNEVSECDECCGGELQQTRTCQSKMGSCPNAQLTRKIKCKHVCQEVKCADSSMIFPHVLRIVICILTPFFF